MLRMTAWIFWYGTALSAVFAETSSLPRTAEDRQAIRSSAARYVAQCLKDWDKGTHMNKAEWKSACRRLADDREDFMLEYPASKTTPEG
jgi:hypothetical protein